MIALIVSGVSTAVLTSCVCPSGGKDCPLRHSSSFNCVASRSSSQVDFGAASISGSHQSQVDLWIAWLFLRTEVGV